MYKIGWCSLARIKTHKTRDKPCSVQNGEAIVLHLDSSRPPRSLLWPPGVDTVLKPPKATSMFAYLPSLYSCSEQLCFQKQRYTSIERAIPCSHKGMGKKHICWKHLTGPNKEAKRLQNHGSTTEPVRSATLFGKTKRSHHKSVPCLQQSSNAEVIQTNCRAWWYVAGRLSRRSNG